MLRARNISEDALTTSQMYDSNDISPSSPSKHFISINNQETNSLLSSQPSRHTIFSTHSPTSVNFPMTDEKVAKENFFDYLSQRFHHYSIAEGLLPAATSSELQIAIKQLSQLREEVELAFEQTSTTDSWRRNTLQGWIEKISREVALNEEFLHQEFDVDHILATSIPKSLEDETLSSVAGCSESNSLMSVGNQMGLPTTVSLLSKPVKSQPFYVMSNKLDSPLEWEYFESLNGLFRNDRSYSLEEGLPKVMDVCNSILAVGTSRGKIIVLYTRNEFTVTLGSPDDVEKYGTIVCLSISEDSGMIIVGYSKGFVALWDIDQQTRASILISPGGNKRRKRLLQVGFVRGHNLLYCVNGEGCIIFFESKRGWLSTSYEVSLFRPDGFPKLHSGDLSPFPKFWLQPLIHPIDGNHFVMAAVPYRDKLLIISISHCKDHKVLLEEFYDHFLHSSTEITSLTWIPNPNNEKEWPYLTLGHDNIISTFRVMVKSLENKNVDGPLQCSYFLSHVGDVILYEKIVQVDWVADSIVGAIDKHNVFHFVDISKHSLIESVDFSNENIVFSQPRQFIKSFYQSVKVVNGDIYLLCLDGVKKAVLQSPLQRIRKLVAKGNEEDALTLLLSIYQNQSSIVYSENEPDQNQRDKILQEEMKRLILFKLQTLFKNSFTGMDCGTSLDVDEEQCQRFSLLVINIGQNANLLEFLYDEVYEIYLKAKQQRFFLEALESYILLNKLDYISPVVANQFVEHYHNGMMLNTLEECLLHLDPSILNLDFVIHTCRNLQLYNALIYIYNHGLNDYVTPIVELMNIYLKSSSNSPHSEDVITRSPYVHQQSSSQYQLFLYLSCIIHGQKFPQGTMTQNDAVQVKSTCCDFLFSPQHLVSKEKDQNSFHIGKEPFPYIRTLLEMGFEETLSILKYVFEDNELDSLYSVQPSVCSKESDHLVNPNDNVNVDNSRQFIVKVLLEIITHDSSPFQLTHSVQLYIFIARSMSQYRRYITFGPDMYFKMMLLLAKTESHCSRQLRELAVNQILEVFKLSPDQEQELLPLFEEAGFFETCQLLYMKLENFDKMINCFIQHQKLEGSKKGEQASMFQSLRALFLSHVLSSSSKEKLCQAILNHFQQLLTLNGKNLVFLIMDHFKDYFNTISGHLQGDEVSRFHFYKFLLEYEETQNEGLIQDKVLSGLLKMDKVDYLDMLCRFQPEEVEAFIKQQFSSMPISVQLEICRKHRCTESITWILEKSGDIVGAFKIYYDNMRNNIDKVLLCFSKTESYDVKMTTEEKEKESIKNEKLDISGIRSLLVVGLGYFKSAIGVLKRYHGDSKEDIEKCWFELLDILVLCNMEVSKNKGVEGIQNRLLEESLVQFTQAMTTGMVGSVSLPSLLQHLLEENGQKNFGEIRELFCNILDAYHYEESLVSCTSQLLLQDVWNVVQQNVKAHERGVHVTSSRCAGCGKLLNSLFALRGPLRNSSFLSMEDNDVVVLSCGDAVHLQCLAKDSSLETKHGQNCTR